MVTPYKWPLKAWYSRDLGNLPTADDDVEAVKFDWFIRTGNVQNLHIAFFIQLSLGNLRH